MPSEWPPKLTFVTKRSWRSAGALHTWGKGGGGIASEESLRERSRVRLPPGSAESHDAGSDALLREHPRGVGLLVLVELGERRREIPPLNGALRIGDEKGLRLEVACVRR